MKVLELFSLSRGKPLHEFDWGMSFIDLINQNLPISHRITDPATTGDFLYTQLLQLPGDKMFMILQMEVEVRGDKVGVSRVDGQPPRQMEHQSVYTGNFADPEPSPNKKSKTPMIALICAVSLVVLCLGMAFTQAILSVKSGRNVGDGQSVTTIASIIGDVAKAFIDSGSTTNQNRQRPNYSDQNYPYYDNGSYQQQPYSRPNGPQQPSYRNQEPYQPYDPNGEHTSTEEPMRPQSGMNNEPPPYN